MYSMLCYSNLCFQGNCFLFTADGPSPVILWEKDDLCLLLERFSQVWSWNSTISITWGLFVTTNTHAASLDLLTGNCGWGPATCVLVKLPGDSNAWQNLRTLCWEWALEQAKLIWRPAWGGLHCQARAEVMPRRKAIASWTGMRKLEEINQLLAERLREDT